MFALLALVSLLIACGTSSQSSTSNPVPTNPNGSGASTTWDEIKGWFYNVAWSTAGVPIIGPLITGILGKVNPEDQWWVGVGIIFIILSALGGAANR